MQLHELKPKTRRKSKKIIGRGGKRGTYSGRGIKGQKARAGRKMRPEVRDILKKVPKLRGERGQKHHSRTEKPSVVNVDAIARVFDANATVTPKTLAEHNLIGDMKSKKGTVKILGRGVIDKPVTVSECVVSASAREKITKAGGSVTE